MSEVKYEIAPDNYQAPPAIAETTAAPAAPEVPATPEVQTSEPAAAEAAPAPEPSKEATPPEPTKTVDLPPPPAPAAQEEVDYYEKLGLPKGGGDFTKIIDAWKANKLDEYLRIATADYTKMDAMSLVRMEFDKSYSTLKPEDRDMLWQHKLETQYHITGDAETDKYAMLEIQAKAEAIRSGLIAEQQNYKLPTYEAPQDNTEQQRIEDANRLREEISSMPDFRELEVSKALKLGEGEDAFNYELPFDVRKAVLEDNLLADFWKMGPDGKPHFDVKTFAMAKALVADPQGFISKIINQGRSYEAKKNFQELNNPAPAAPGGNLTNRPKYELVD